MRFYIGSANRQIVVYTLITNVEGIDSERFYGRHIPFSFLVKQTGQC